MAAPTVALIGMKAFRRDINRLADDQSSALYTAIKAAGRQAAAPVAERARATVPHVSGTLAGDIRISATKTGAAVRMGRKKVPYAGWVEFGGTRPDSSSRTYVAAGRYLFPAAAGLAGVSAAAYSAALERLFDNPGIWTNTTTDGAAVRD